MVVAAFVPPLGDLHRTREGIILCFTRSTIPLDIDITCSVREGMCLDSCPHPNRNPFRVSSSSACCFPAPCRSHIRLANNSLPQATPPTASLRNATGPSLRRCRSSSWQSPSQFISCWSSSADNRRKARARYTTGITKLIAWYSNI